MLIHERPAEQIERRTMSVHLVADDSGTIAALRAILASHYVVTSALLGNSHPVDSKFDSVIIAADLKVVENIAALKENPPNIQNCSEEDLCRKPEGALAGLSSLRIGRNTGDPSPINCAGFARSALRS